MANRSCTTCVYAWWDQGHWLTSLSTGFPSRPVCANHPDTPGLMRPVPYGSRCRNYRPKPPEPEGDVKRIPLGDGLYAYVDSADHKWLSQWSWHFSNGYAVRWENWHKRVYMHRQIVQPPDGMIVDHINQNKLDNSRVNLRVCTRPENQRNQRKREGSSSRFKGVGFRKAESKWFAEIHYEGQQIWLGLFDDEIEAARAYDHKAVGLFGEFAWLNLPEEWPPQRRREVYANAQAALKKEIKKTARKEGKKARRKQPQSNTQKSKTKANRKKARTKYKPRSS